MYVVRAYLKDKGIVAIDLHKNVTILDNIKKFLVDEKTLKIKQQPGTIGISHFKTGRIDFFEDNTYKGIIFSSHYQFEGTWSLE